MIREIVSRVQTMRKEAGFEVTDRIELSYLADGLAGKVLAEKGEEIGNSVLALSVNEGLFAGGYEKSFDIGDDKATFSVRKVGKA